jgi:flagellar basal-body rod modification protein FlgD
MSVAAVSGVLGTSQGARTEANTNSSGNTGNTGGTTGTNSAGNASPTAGTTQIDRDTFLKLLVAQLKYQDPSKPADASAMISQSAELSVVEKLDTIAQALAETQSTNRLTLGGSMIGKQVTFKDSNGSLTSQVVTAVSFSGTEMVLRAGNWDVPIGSVLSIAAAPATTSTTPTTTTTGSTGSSN